MSSINQTSSALDPFQGETEDSVQGWLKSVGFSFDPFSHLEASADSRLSTYLVGHDAFEIAWGDWPTFVFALAGGGKTALRARVAQACWIGQETNRPFPLPYVLPFLQWSHVKPSLEEHLAALVQAGTLHLLLVLAHRPHWFMRLDEAGRQAVRQSMDWNLPGPLAAYLAPCREEGTLNPLRERFPPASLPPDPPDADALMDFCEVLEHTHSLLTSSPPAEARWEGLLDVLLDVLHLPAVYILLDGLDGVGETADDTAAAVYCLTPLMPLIPEWTKRRVYFKAFIPIETRPILEREYPIILEASQTVALEWTPALLAEVVRRRVYVASEGAYGSLGPLATPDLRDIETVLAREALPLPREMLVLTYRVLTESTRWGLEARIEPRDVEAAVQWYAANKPEIVERIVL